MTTGRVLTRLPAAAVVLALGACASAPDSTAPPGAASLSGDWVGSYVCAQGLTNLVLHLETQSDGSIVGEFAFSAHPSNPDTPGGRYVVVGEMEGDRLTLRPREWIDQPPGYVMVGLDGTIDGGTYNGTITDPSCKGFHLTVR